MKGVLLDIDGTLVLSNDAHAESWVEAFAQYGYQAAFEDVRPLIGMGGDKLMAKLFLELDHEQGVGKRISKTRTKLFLDEYMQTLQPAPGSRDLVLKLRQRGLKLMVASSAKQKDLQALLEAARVDDLLREATTSDDAKNSKPDPDIVKVALDRIGLSAKDTIMIGDTPYDIEAAQACGVGVIAVRCGGWGDHDLAGAIALYDDPADLVTHFSSSPLES